MNQQQALTHKDFPTLSLNVNLTFKQFINRLRDHIVRSRRDLTHLRLHLLCENSDELILQFDQFTAKLRQQQQQQQQQQQPQQQQQQPPQPPMEIQTQQFLHQLLTRGIPRRSQISERLTTILGKLQSITSDFQYIHTLLSAPANTQSSEASSKQMHIIQTMLTHIISPTQRPLNIHTLLVRQTPLSCLRLQELHSQYISSAFLPPDKAMSGIIDDDESNATSTTATANSTALTNAAVGGGGIYPSGIIETDEVIKNRTDRLEKLLVPEDVYEALASQTAADVSKVLDDFNKCVGTVLKEIRIEQKHLTIKELELIYNDSILRYAFRNVYLNLPNTNPLDNATATYMLQQQKAMAQQQEAMAMHNNRNQKASFDAQIAMMTDGNGFRGVD